MTDNLTTREVAVIFGQSESRIRRIVDRLGTFPRFGGKRAIPRDRLPEIASLLTAKQSKEVASDRAS
jgi:hypothetical protein